MRIALAQITSGSDPVANLRLVLDRLDEAAAKGARVVVFPEATMAAFGSDLRAVAEPLDGPWLSQVRARAEHLGVVVVVGVWAPAGERVRNVLAVVGQGEPIGYAKLHLFDAFGTRESDTVEAGDEPVVVEVDGVGIGLATCYDVRFPALFTTLARAGAHVCVVSASWGAGEGKVEQWELLTRARALDATSWVVAVGQADPQAAGVAAAPGAPTGVGHSGIVDPWGRDVMRLGAAPELALVDVDPGLADEVRRTVPVLQNARPL